MGYSPYKGGECDLKNSPKGKPVCDRFASLIAMGQNIVSASAGILFAVLPETGLRAIAGRNRGDVSVVKVLAENRVSLTVVSRMDETVPERRFDRSSVGE